MDGQQVGVDTPELSQSVIDWGRRDMERGQAIIDSFISWVNADDEDAITISRTKGCYMRDEIERLRKVEAKLVSMEASQ